MSVDGRGWLLEGIILHQPTYNCSTKNNQICVWFQKALEKHLYWDQWILKLTLSQLLILILNCPVQLPQNELLVLTIFQLWLLGQMIS